MKTGRYCGHSRVPLSGNPVLLLWIPDQIGDDKEKTVTPACRESSYMLIPDKPE